MMRNRFIAAVFAAVLGLSSGGFADVIFFGDTTGGPTMDNRPLSFTGQSGTGANVRYFLQPFYVDTTGEYIFEVDSDPANGAYTHTDQYALVYGPGGFNPSGTGPLNNLIAGDDDFSGAYTILPGASSANTQGSRIALGESSNFGGAGTGLLLTANTQYYAVITGFGTSNFGSFTAGIGDGPGGGTVTLGFVAIPEPNSLAILGLLGVGLVARRRRRS